MRGIMSTKKPPESEPGDLSIVIPVYNSARILPVLIDRVASAMADAGLAFELILVNDGSQDDSWQIILEHAAGRDWLRGINLMRNFGQHNALLCGIRAARNPIIITMDDDLQHPPEEIPKLLAELERGHDVVYGSARLQQHGFLRNLASNLTKLALKSAMGIRNARNVSAFRAFRTKLRAAFADYSGTFVSIDVLLTWGTGRFSAIEVRHEPRFAGESQYTLRKLITHALNMMTGFGTLPLQIASLVGLVFTLFGLGILAYVLVRWMLQGSVVPGFPFLASIIAIFSGAQLFALGIIGEYLARMHYRLMDRPPYVEECRLPEKQAGDADA